MTRHMRVQVALRRGKCRRVSCGRLACLAEGKGSGCVVWQHRMHTYDVAQLVESLQNSQRVMVVREQKRARHSHSERM